LFGIFVLTHVDINITLYLVFTL
jgi:hypothetical protein